MTQQPSTRLRWLAWLLIRGRDAEFVRHDLDALYARDRATGLSRWRAGQRYRRRLFESAYCLWRARVEWVELPGVEWLHDARHGAVLQDVRFASRLFLKHPAPVSIAIAGLALAIGIVVSVFTLVDAMILRPYGMDDPGSVVRVGHLQGPIGVDGMGQEHGWPYWSYASFRRMQEEATQARVEASLIETVEVSTAPAPAAGTRRRLLFVSGGYLAMLGGRPVVGRTLGPGDDTIAAARVVMVSHHMWTTELGADPSIGGKTIWVNGAPVTVVGVMQPDFTGPEEMPASMWAPLAAFDDLNTTSDISVIARLPHGSSLQRAQAELSAVFARAAGGTSTSTTAAHATRVWLYGISPLEGPKATESYAAIAFFFVLFGLVLAAACANTANLLLAAAATRTREMGVRLALGATRRRLVRQTLNESLLLGCVAAAFAWLFAVWFLPVLSRALQLSGETGARPDLRAFAFTMGVAFVCSLGAAWSPARYGARDTLGGALKSNDTAPKGRSRLRRSFVGFQAAMAMFLLIVSGLFARSSVRMSSVDVGFDVDRMFGIYVDAPRSGFDEAAYMASAAMIVRAQPMVERVSVTQYLPFGSFVEHDRFTHGGRSYQVDISRADPELFAAAGLRVVHGRSYSSEEADAEAPVALISEALARAFFGGNAVGQPLSKIPADGGLPQMDATIVGIVADAMLTPLRSQAGGAIYRPIARTRSNPASLLVRSANPQASAAAVKTLLRGLDPRVRPAVYFPREGLDAFMGGLRLLAVLSLPLAGLVLLLGVVGLFGVTAFSVSQRKKEMSIRVAIGATAAEIVRVLVVDSLRPVAVGLPIGLALAVGLSTFAERQHELPGVDPYDPLAIGVAVVLMLTATVAATFGPALRILRAQPSRLLQG